MAWYDDPTLVNPDALPMGDTTGIVPALPVAPVVDERPSPFAEINQQLEQSRQQRQQLGGLQGLQAYGPSYTPEEWAAMNPPAAPAEQPSAGLWQTAKDVGGGIVEAFRGAPAVVASALEGVENPDKNINYGDEIINDTRARHQKEIDDLKASGEYDRKMSVLPFTRGEWLEITQSFPYTLAGIVPSIIGNVAGSAAGGAAMGALGANPLTVAGGAIVGGLAGATAASYNQMGSSSANQFIRDAVDKYKFEFKQKEKRDPTYEEVDQYYKSDVEPQASRIYHGEAAPESLGTAVETSIAKSAIGDVLKSSGSLPLRLLKAGAKVAINSFGIEPATETITQQIQQPAYAAVGMSNGEGPRSMTSVDDWMKSAGEVYKQAATTSLFFTTLGLPVGAAHKSFVRNPADAKALVSVAENHDVRAALSDETLLNLAERGKQLNSAWVRKNPEIGSVLDGINEELAAREAETPEVKQQREQYLAQAMEALPEDSPAKAALKEIHTGERNRLPKWMTWLTEESPGLQGEFNKDGTATGSIDVQRLNQLGVSLGLYGHGLALQLRDTLKRTAPPQPVVAPPSIDPITGNWTPTGGQGEGFADGVAEKLAQEADPTFVGNHAKPVAKQSDLKVGNTVLYGGNTHDNLFEVAGTDTETGLIILRDPTNPDPAQREFTIPFGVESTSKIPLSLQSTDRNPAAADEITVPEAEGKAPVKTLLKVNRDSWNKAVQAESSRPVAGLFGWDVIETTDPIRFNELRKTLDGNKVAAAADESQRWGLAWEQRMETLEEEVAATNDVAARVGADPLRLSTIANKRRLSSPDRGLTYLQALEETAAGMAVVPKPKISSGEFIVRNPNVIGEQESSAIDSFINSPEEQQQRASEYAHLNELTQNYIIAQREGNTEDAAFFEDQVKTQQQAIKANREARALSAIGQTETQSAQEPAASPVSGLGQVSNVAGLWGTDLNSAVPDQSTAAALPPIRSAAPTKATVTNSITGETTVLDTSAGAGSELILQQMREKLAAQEAKRATTAARRAAPPAVPLLALPAPTAPAPVAPAAPLHPSLMTPGEIRAAYAETPINAWEHSYPQWNRIERAMGVAQPMTAAQHQQAVQEAVRTNKPVAESVRKAAEPKVVKQPKQEKPTEATNKPNKQTDAPVTNKEGKDSFETIIPDGKGTLVSPRSMTPEEAPINPGKEPTKGPVPDADIAAAKGAPGFQGGKRFHIEKSLPNIRFSLRNVREKVTKIYDFFGGGGGWGLALADRVAVNAQELHLFELNPNRALKIQLFMGLNPDGTEREGGISGEKFIALANQLKSTIGSVSELINRMADEAKAENINQIDTDGNLSTQPIKVVDAKGKTKEVQPSWRLLSAGTLAIRITGLLESIPLNEADTRAVLQAIIDQGNITRQTPSFSNATSNVMRGKSTEEQFLQRVNELFDNTVNIVANQVEGVQKNLARIRKTRPDFKVFVRQGNSFEVQPEQGAHVLSVYDPPYYGTAGYDGTSLVPIGIYEQVYQGLKGLHDAGNHVIYTDELWWGKKDLPPDISGGEGTNPDRPSAYQIYNGIRSIIPLQWTTVKNRTELLGVYANEAGAAAINPGTGSNATDSTGDPSATGRGPGNTNPTGTGTPPNPPGSGVGRGTSGKGGNTDSGGGPLKTYDIDVKLDNIITAIAKLGGINSRHKSEVVRDTVYPNPAIWKGNRLFSDNGLDSLDDLAQTLSELGYPTLNDNQEVGAYGYNGSYDPESLKSAINAALSGTPVYTLEGMEHYSNQSTEQEQRDRQDARMHDHLNPGGGEAGWSYTTTANGRDWEIRVVPYDPTDPTDPVTKAVNKEKTKKPKDYIYTDQDIGNFRLYARSLTAQEKQKNLTLADKKWNTIATERTESEEQEKTLLDLPKIHATILEMAKGNPVDISDSMFTPPFPAARPTQETQQADPVEPIKDSDETTIPPADDAADYEVPFSRSTQKASGLTRAEFMPAIRKQLSELARFVEKNLKLGEQGKKGGLVLIDDADIDAIAKVFAEKTGRSFEDARHEIQASITAWHGTPHRFQPEEGAPLGRFTTQKMGSGEGNQTYGWGLYFTGKREIAEHYKNVLSKKANTKGSIYQVDLKPSEDSWLLWDRPLEEQNDIVRQLLGDFEKVYTVKHSRKQKDGTYSAEVTSPNARNISAQAYGNTKEEAIKNAVDKMYQTFIPYGRGIYSKITAEKGSPRAASEYMASIGIPGIKYLTGESRYKGKGDYNYVVFEDQSVEITAQFSKDGNINGFYDPRTGLTFAVLPNLSAETALPVVLHEAIHGIANAKLRAALNDAAFDLVNRRGKMSGPMREYLDTVYARLSAAGALNDKREYPAYMTEVAVEMGRKNGFNAADGKFLDWVDTNISKSVGDFIRRMINLIRAAMFKAGVPLKLANLTPDDLISFATAGVQAAAKGKVGTTETTFKREGKKNAIHKQYNRSNRQQLMDQAIRLISPGGTSGMVQWIRADLEAGALASSRNGTQVPTGTPRDTGRSVDLVATGDYIPFIGRTVGAVQIDTFRTGIRKVTTPEQAAAVLLPISRKPQEHLVALVTDRQGKPLAIIQHTVGTSEESLVDDKILVGSAANIPNADQIWFAHNHPSTDPVQSRSDYQVSASLNNLLNGSGLTNKGMIVLAANQSATWVDPETMDETSLPNAKVMGNKPVPVMGRQFILFEEGQTLLKQSEQTDFLKQFNEPGVLLLDGDASPLAWVPMNKADMTKLRSGTEKAGSTRLMRVLEQTNADWALVKIEDASKDELPVKNMMGFFSTVKIKNLDAQDKQGNIIPADNKTKVFHSGQPGSTFYSGLARAIESMPQKKAPGPQWVSILDNLTKKGQVKQEEIDWSGINEWLKEQTGYVAKTDLVNQINANEVVVEDNFVSPRHPNLTLAGATNQQELVLSVPTLTSWENGGKSHYSDVAGGRGAVWIRMNDRIDENGNKVLLLEEIQSQRHQDGRQIGYRRFGTIKPDDLRMVFEKDGGYDGGPAWAFYENDSYVYSLEGEFNQDQKQALEAFKDKAKEYPDVLDRSRINMRHPGDAPFKATISGSSATLSGWAGLAFKRMLRYAAENGYQSVAWTTGDTQAARYPQYGQSIVKGMRGFYDVMLPNEINKYVKKWGAKVGTSEIDANGPVTVHSVPVTPAMVESVMQGQPLFSRKTDLLNAAKKAAVTAKNREVVYAEEFEYLEAQDVTIMPRKDGTKDIVRGRVARVKIDGNIYFMTPATDKAPHILLPNQEFEQNWQKTTDLRSFVALTGDKSSVVQSINTYLNKTFEKLGIADPVQYFDAFYDPFGGAMLYEMNLDVMRNAIFNSDKPVIISVSEKHEPKMFAVYKAIKENDREVIGKIQRFLDEDILSGDKNIDSILREIKSRKSRSKQARNGGFSELVKLLQRDNVTLNGMDMEQSYAAIEQAALEGKKIFAPDDSNYGDLLNESPDLTYEKVEDNPQNPQVLLDSKRKMYQAVRENDGMIVATNNQTPDLLNGLVNEFGDTMQAAGFMHFSQYSEDTALAKKNPEEYKFLANKRPEFLAIIDKRIDHERAAEPKHQTLSGANNPRRASAAEIVDQGRATPDREGRDDARRTGLPTGSTDVRTNRSKGQEDLPKDSTSTRPGSETEPNRVRQSRTAVNTQPVVTPYNDNADDVFAESGRYADEKKQLTDWMIKNYLDLSGLQLSNQEGTRFALLLPDASDPGKFRYQLFDEKGFSGHETFDTQEEALTDVIDKEDLTVVDDGALQRLSKTDTWKKGTEATALIQQFNLGKVRFSRTAATGSPATETQAQAVLRSLVGNKEAAALINSGRVVIHGNTLNLSDQERVDKIGAYIDEKGNIHLVLPFLSADMLNDLIDHESGHLSVMTGYTEGDLNKIKLVNMVLRFRGLRGLVGKPGFDDMIAQINRMADNGVESAVRARETVDNLIEQGKLTAEDRNHELLAYTLEYAPKNLPIYRRILAAIRAALYRVGIKVQLNDTDLVAMARGALKQRARAVMQYGDNYSAPGDLAYAAKQKPTPTLTNAEKSASLIPLLYTESDQTYPPQMVRDAAQFLQQRTRDGNGGKIRKDTPEDNREIKRILRAEARAALDKTGNAENWYGTKIAEALNIVALLHPEIAEDPIKQGVFLYALAATSQGLSVERNIKLAEKVYNDYKTKGKFIPVGEGTSANTMVKQLSMFNRLVEQHGIERVVRFMFAKFEHKEIQSGVDGIKASVSEMFDDQEIFGSLLMGPKIGSFFQNLAGNLETFTIDMWVSRMWGRLTGNLILLPAEQEKAKNRFIDSLTPAVREHMGIDETLPSDTDELLKIASNALGRYIGKGKNTFPKTAEFEEAGKASRQFKAAANPKDSPKSTKKREWMNRIALQVADELGIQPANLQAILWYPEKELYAKLGVRDNESAPTDYSAELSKLAQQRGISDEDVRSAITAAGHVEGNDGQRGGLRRLADVYIRGGNQRLNRTLNESDRSVAPNKRFSRTQAKVTDPQTTTAQIDLFNANRSKADLDTEYMNAVNRGDMETAQRMVEDAAKDSGAKLLPDDSTNVGYKTRRSPPPKKTVKVYKAFRMRDGKLYPMFVGAKDDLPIGTWMDATEGGYHFTGDNGREYIPADTGVSVPIPNDNVRDELLKRGYIKSASTKSIKVVAYRPGWHGGELPFFPQAGNKVIHKGKKLITEAPDGYAYPNVHEFDTVIAEVEMDADRNYKQEYIDTAERNADGSINKQKSGLRFIPKGGFYEYATNPLFADRPDLGKWFISGSVKINRILSQDEANQQLDKMDVPRQAWNASKTGKFDALDLNSLGYDPQFNHVYHKLLDPVTYDDSGNVIPLSERFNLKKRDIRYSRKIAPPTSGVSTSDNQQPTDEKELTSEQKAGWATAAIKLLVNNKDIFQYKISSKTDMAEIAAELIPEIKVSKPDASRQNPLRAYRSFGQSWTVTMPDGKTADILTSKSGREVYIDASGLEEGESRGSVLYQLAGQWAYNNKKVFVGDPEGISAPGKARRLEHIISLSLKFGTTDFFMPHPYQEIPWKVGQHDYNITQLLIASSKAIQEAVPDLKAISYDFDRRGFFRRNGQAFDGALFKTHAESAGARSARAGSSTLKRSVLFNSLVQRAGGETWRSVLAELTEQSRSGGLDPNLLGIFYSKTTAPAQAGVSVSAIEKLIEPFREQWKQSGLQVTAVQSVADLPADLRNALVDDQIEGFYDAQTNGVYLIADNLNGQKRAKRVLNHEVVGHWAIQNLRSAPEFVQILRALRQLEKVGNKDIAKIAQQVDASQPGLDSTDRGSEIFAVAIEQGLHEKIGLLKTWATRLLQGFKAFLRTIGLDNNFVNSLTMNDVLLFARETQQKLNRGEVSQDGRWVFSGRQVANSYAGERAKTADQSLLQQAKDRVDSGEDAEVVRKETGWFLNQHDKKWRFEIDDSDFSFNSKWIQQQRDIRDEKTKKDVAADFDDFDSSAWEAEPDSQYSLDNEKLLDSKDIFIDRFETNLEQIISHPQLFDAYPQLKGIEVDLIVNTNAQYDPRGSYNPADKSIEIKAYTYEGAKKILIHEIQHAVQNIEGHSQGTSPAEFNENEFFTRKDEGTIQRAKLEIEKITKQQKKARSDKSKFARLRDILPKGSEERAAADAKRKAAIQEENRLALEISKWYPSKLYMRSMGEVEARDTANRLDLTAEQRREKTPYKATMFKDGIADSDVIVKTNGGVAASLSYSRPTPIDLNNPRVAKKTFDEIGQNIMDQNPDPLTWDRIWDIGRNNFNRGLALLNRQQLIELGSRKIVGLGRALLPSAKFFENAAALMDGIKSRIKREMYDGLIEPWQREAGKNRKNAYAFDFILHGSTLHQVDPTQAMREQNELESDTDYAKAVEWHGILSDKLKDLAKMSPILADTVARVFDNYVKINDMKYAAMKERVGRSGFGMVRTMLERVRKMQPGNPAAQEVADTLAILKVADPKDLRAVENLLKQFNRFKSEEVDPTKGGSFKISSPIVATDHNAMNAIKLKYQNFSKAQKKLFKARERLAKAPQAARLFEYQQRDADGYGNLVQLITSTQRRAINVLVDRVSKKSMVPEEHAAMQAELAKLPEDAQSLYNDIIDSHTASQSDMMDTIELYQEASRGVKPYVPLSRFGKYEVFGEKMVAKKDKKGQPVIDDNGQPVMERQVSFSKFATIHEQKNAAKFLKAEGWTVSTDYQVIRDHVKTAPSGSFIGKMFGFIDDTVANDREKSALKDSLYNMYLENLPDMSVRKHLMKRAGIAGYNRDALRAYGQFMNGSANMIARLRYADVLTEQLFQMEEEVSELSNHENDQAKAGAVLNELISSYDWLMNPSNATWANRMTALGFIWYLTNPSTALINLSQIPLLTFPELASKFGGGKAAGGLMRAMKDYFRVMNETRKMGWNPLNPPMALKATKQVQDENGQARDDIKYFTYTNEAEYLKAIKQMETDGFTVDRAITPLEAAIMQTLGGEYKGDMGRFMEFLEKSGRVSRSATTQLAGLGEDSWQTQNNLKGKFSRFSGTAMKAGAFLFHHSEVANREITAIAAYRMMREKLKALPEEQAHQQAQEYAYNAVTFTQGDYSNANRARFMRGDFMRVIALFRTFAQMMTWRLTRDFYQSISGKGVDPVEKSQARARFGWMMLNISLLGGAMGLPMYTMIVNIINALAPDDPDDPWDFELWAQKQLGEMLGDTGRQAIMTGPAGLVPMLFGAKDGFNLSTRLSLDIIRMWIRKPPGDLEGNDLVNNWLQQAAGPAFGLAFKAAQGAKDLKHGVAQGSSDMLFRGTESLLPAPLANLTKAWRFQTEGVQTRRGDKIVDDVSTGQLISQSFGFQPAELYEKYQQNDWLNREKTGLDRRKKDLINGLVYAIEEKDSEAQAEKREQIAQYNQKNPADRIKPSQIQNAIKQRRLRVHWSMNGMYVQNKGMRKRLEAERYLDDEEE